VTVLFCDITGSTALGESTDPEVLRALLARYFERMKGIIESHGGTVEKFIGDAVMAAFGVPLLHEDDALRAVRAASEMQAALPELGLRARIGINSGEVVTGTSERLATGDAVNVAARLEQAAAPGGVLLGQETARLVRDAVEIEAVPPLVMKGKADPVPAYRLLGLLGLKELAERRSLASMIGRERELERLRLAYGQAVDDRSCQLFTVLGAAGVGKSRLVAELLVRLDGARVVRGRCLPYGQGITYWPVVEVIKQLDALPADEFAAAALQSLLGESAVSASAEEIAWGFRTLLQEQAQGSPLVVVFDDIHWGEATFLDLVEHVADLSRDVPMLLLCMARPELLEKRPNWGGGKWNATTVLLEPLDANEADRLLDELGGVKEELKESIRAAAEGNPLFLEETVALLKESGEGEVTIPPTIQALLAARLDQLDADERSVLECGSVEGRVFHQSAVKRLLGEETNLPGKLIALVRKELVRPSRTQMRGDEAYRFRHLLIRDAAYESLPKAVRAELHERFAAWVEERGADLAELGEVAGYHLEQATRYRLELGQAVVELSERAGERLATAGRRALWRGDTRAAEGLLKRALDLLRPIRRDVYLELELADLQPTFPEQAAAAREIAEQARTANDRRGEAVAKVVAASHGMWTAATTVDDLEALALDALPLAKEAGDHEGQVRIWQALGLVSSIRGRFGTWTEAAEEAIAQARQIGRPHLTVRLEVFDLPISLVYGPRPADEALQILDSLLADHPHPETMLGRARLPAMLGRFDEAWATALEARLRLRELTGDDGLANFALTEIAMLKGDYEAAASYGHILCDWLEAHGNLGHLATFAPKVGRALCRLGRYEEAEPLARLARELDPDEQDSVTQAVWRQVQALVCSHREQHEEAVRLAREAVALLGRGDALNDQGDTLCDLAEVLERAGQSEEAMATLEQALERYERKRNLAMVAQVRKWLEAPAIADNSSIRTD
jgi:class 3 adenylate cyclase/tetratricopeptide (TPR) repeat protein